MFLPVIAWGQDEPAPQQKEKVINGYSVRQSVDLGGRVVNSSGSDAMYSTLVDLHSGPRILDQSLEMRAVPGTEHPFFDSLSMSNSGYGGDPEDMTSLRMAQGKIYNLQGLFRRDHQYFDYALLDNPLVPPGVTSNGYTFPQVLDSPHLFNTVRRMTDLGLTLFPVSRVSFRAGYSQNINHGPSLSSQHNGAEGLYLQNWRNSTDNWMGALDWKPISKTTLTYEETLSHYKGDTNWQLIPNLPLQLAGGTPVTLGFDNVTAPNCGDGNPAIVSTATTPPTANPTCSGYVQYSRVAPTRSFFPTEEFRFQSSSLKSVDVNGRVSYTGANMNLPNYVEFFYGLDNMGKRQFTTTGNANAKRINVAADYSVLLRISEKFSVVDQFDFLDFRQPGLSNMSEVDLLGTSMLLPPGAPQPAAVTFAPTFMGMKTTTNRVTLLFEPVSKLTASVGYRYRARDISWNMPLSTDALPNGTAYTFPIHENAGILNLNFQPSRQWKFNGNVEASYDDKAYTQISPRQLEHYRFLTRYQPRAWATITGSFNDIESRDNITLVNHLDHNRGIGIATEVTPTARYGFDFNYGYTDIFSRTTLCYASTLATGPLAGAAPSDCGTNTNLGTGYYDAPTQYASAGVKVSPAKTLQAGAGYRISSVNGTTEFLNPLQVPGSLQSKYQSPYADFAWTLRDGWGWKGVWNYYGYGEDGAIGPTSARDFHANNVALALHYEF